MFNMSKHIHIETAKVYRAGGRRWFTKKAACRARAREIISERCDCEPNVRWGDGSCDVTSGWTCWYHKNPQRLEKAIRRMTRIIEKALKKDIVFSKQNNIKNS